MQHRMMFNPAGEDMIPSPDRSKNCQIVALRAAAGEDDFRWPAPQQSRHAGPCLLHRGTRPLPLLVDRGGIAKLLHQERPHRLQHLRQQRSGGIRIQVNSPHHTILRVRHKSGTKLDDSAQVRQSAPENLLGFLLLNALKEGLP